ncbi:hypothetical protein [Micromonospora sp. NBC_01638]|uniref:hypothetical protein n=1 Tax=Micromonospora sp. NBC_01638 TaxID=2975982 RepID=UPI003865B0ED|nr:hypothetical protein OG811_12640 [Micromonospora sp. NBC_01638]
MNVRLPAWRVPGWLLVFWWLGRGLFRLAVLAARYWWMSPPSVVVAALRLIPARRGWFIPSLTIR